MKANPSASSATSVDLSPVRLGLALSVRQPWAWCILHGKDIENRTWRTLFRGSIYLHAARP